MSVLIFNNLGKEAIMGRGSNARAVSIVSFNLRVVALGNTNRFPSTSGVWVVVVEVRREVLES